MLRILEVEFTELTAEDGQKRNIMPVLFQETASHLRYVIPWTDSLEAAFNRTAARTVSRQPPSTGSSLQDGPNPKETKCRTSSSNWRASCGHLSK